MEKFYNYSRQTSVNDFSSRKVEYLWDQLIEFYKENKETEKEYNERLTKEWEEEYQSQAIKSVNAGNVLEKQPPFTIEENIKYYESKEEKMKKWLKGEIR